MNEKGIILKFLSYFKTLQVEQVFKNNILIHFNSIKSIKNKLIILSKVYKQTYFKIILLWS